MGVMDNLAQEGRKRVLLSMGRTGLEPVMLKLEQALEQQNQILEQQALISQELSEIPSKIEVGEEGRAERLRQTIQPTARALIEGMQILHTEISMFRAAVERQEAESQTLRAEVSALRQETAAQQEAVTILQQDLAAFRETSTAGAITDQMRVLVRELAESRLGVNALLDASADLLTQLSENGQPVPTSPGEKKWNAQKRQNADSEILPLAAAWRLLMMDAQKKNPAMLPILAKFLRQAREAHPHEDEDRILATAWQLMEVRAHQSGPEATHRLNYLESLARTALGL